jgi:dihydrofolate reductase
MWSAWGGAGAEHLLLTVGDDEIVADGLVVGVKEEGGLFRVHYEVRADAAWTARAVRVEAMTVITQTYQRAEAFLFDRRTYEIFAGYWGAMEDLKHPIAGALNRQPEYLASTTLTESGWANTTVLFGDLAAAIGELKAKPGGELQLHGSGALTRWLLDNDLVDEINLLHRPGGRRPGHAAAPRHRPGPGARTGRIVVHPEGDDDPGLPARRPPAVRNGHADLKHVT